MYTKQSIDDKVKSILANVSCIDQDTINADTYLKDDLALDSLDLADVIYKIDSEYGLDIPLHELEKLHTVSELVDHVDHILNPIGI